MKTNRRSPTPENTAIAAPKPKRRFGSVLLRTTLLLAIGVGAFYGLETADRLLMSRLDSVYPELPPATIDAPADTAPAIDRSPAPASASVDRSGNRWLGQALVALEGHASVTASIAQTGQIEGREFQTRGDYLQSGAGTARRFALRLEGRVANQPARLMRVSDSRFLWTDLQWGGGPEDRERSITRIDLRRVRLAIDNGDRPPPAPGAAAPVLIDPGAWSRYGGLPMLLAGLGQSFDFAGGRLMQLRGERVVALVGRWKPDRLADLLEQSPEEPAPLKPPARAPHHVVVALSEATLFPLLVEYRAIDDAMSAGGAPDEALLRPSRRPMLKIEFSAPRFDGAIDPATFAFPMPSDVDFVDQTDHEIQLARNWKTEQLLTAAAAANPRR